MKLNMEQATVENRFWNQVCILAREAFPPEEYLAPEKLMEMANAENFDFWILTDGNTFAGFMVVQTYGNLAYLFFLAIDAACRSKGYGGHAIKALKTAYPDKKQVVDFEKAIAYNPSMIESSKVSKYRTVFFKNLDKKNVTKLLKVYTKNRRGIKGLIASFLDKIGLLNMVKKLIKK